MPFFKRRERTQRTGIFFGSDLHGSTTCFRKFINSVRYYREKGFPVRALVAGGDLTGKLIVPIIREVGRYRSYLTGAQVMLESQEELAGFIRKCETMGVYPHVFTPEEYADFQGSPALQDQLFKQLMLGRLEEWLAFAEERLAGQDVTCYVIPGNDDIAEVDDLLNQSGAVVNVDRKVLRLEDGYSIAGLGLSNPTPFGCPRDVPEADLARHLDALAAEVPEMERCIFNVHVPPFNTGIDVAPLLDDELRPQIGPQGVEMVPVGSTAVREAILKYQPLVSLHGHIHESKGTAMLGRTLCLNPGSEYSDGILRGALVTLGEGRVLSHMLISG